MAAIPKKWDEKFVLEYIQKCIVQDGGIPMFMKKIFGAPLPRGQVILACRDFDNTDLLSSYLLIGVPEDIEKILEKYPKGRYPEWKKIYDYLLSKYMEEAVERYHKYVAYAKREYR